MATALYVRISNDPTGKAAGVKRQEREARQMCAQRDIPVDYVLVDNDLSAYTGKRRPGFEELLSLVEAGMVDTVVVWHPDRLYRRTADLERVIVAVERHKPRILSVMAGEFDLNDATGRAVARTVVAWSTHESEHKIDRQKAAYRDSALNGEWGFTNRPFGYRRELGRVVQVPEEVDVLRDVLTRYYVEGESRYSLTQSLNARGILSPRGKEWGVIQVRDLLKNSHYAGVVTYNGEVIDVAPKWDPIIERATWDSWMTTAAKRKRQSTFTEPRYLLSGIMQCAECGGKVYVHHRANGNGSLAYRCRDKTCAYRRVVDCDALVTHAIKRRLAKDDARDLFTPATPSTAGIAEEIDDIQRKLDDLAALLADGTLTAQGVRDAAAPLRQRRDALQARLTAAQAVPNLPTVEEARGNWDALPLDSKRAVVRVLFQSVKLAKIPGQRFTAACVQLDPAGVVL